MRTIHHRTIAALTVQQRLLGIDPLWTNGINLAMKKIMGRIRITEEVMQDTTDDHFTAAMRKYINGRIYDMATHAWVKP